MADRRIGNAPAPGAEQRYRMLDIILMGLARLG